LTHIFVSLLQYINLDDIMDLVGGDELHSQEQFRIMWRESMKSVNCAQSHITYDNFLLLMKGQTKEPEPTELLLPSPSTRMSSLLVVPEGVQVEEGRTELDVDVEASKDKLSPTLSHHMGEHVHFLEDKNEDEVSLHSLPNIGGQDMYQSSNSSVSLGFSPRSPESRKMIEDIAETSSTKMPGLDGPSGPSGPGLMKRQRSKSLADENEAGFDAEEGSSDSFVVPAFRADSRRALALPEHASSRNNELLAHPGQTAIMNSELGKNMSALAVNRQLYRAHRQMRISVLDASRRFEEQQARRARDTLMAEKEKEEDMMGLGQAGLVMKHGQKVHVTSETIRQYLDDYRAEQQQKVEKANRRGGRGRHARKKTISDMSAMMNPSMGEEELGDVAFQASKTPDVSKKLFNNSLTNIGIDMPDLKQPHLTAMMPPKHMGQGNNCNGHQRKSVGSVAAIEGLSPSMVEVVDKSLRKATVPGQFRTTQDPFRSDGMYGGARIGALTVNQISATAGTQPKNSCG
jgi:hypothetical protein